MSSPSDLWSAPELKAAASDALNAVYAANRLLHAARNKPVTAEKLLNAFLDLLSHAQDARRSCAPVIKEFVAARQKLGNSVRMTNGISDACCVGLGVACAFDVIQAYCLEHDDGRHLGSSVHVSQGSMTEPVVAQITERLVKKDELDTKLFRRLIDEELREATRVRVEPDSRSKHLSVLQRLKEVLVEATCRLNRPAEGVADIHGWDDLGDLAAEINKLRTHLELPRVLEWESVGDRRKYGVKVWDPLRPDGKGVQAIVFHGYELNDFERTANAMNIPTIIEYLQRSVRFVDGQLVSANKPSGDMSQTAVVETGPAKWLDDAMWAPPAGVASTKGFRAHRHDDLVERLQAVLGGQLAGEPRISILQSLQDRGCDLLIEWPKSKFGVQLKSNGDVEQAAFTTKTMAQIQDSHQHGLERIYVVFAADITTDSNVQKIRGMMSRISSMNDPYVICIPPENAWTLLVNPSPSMD